MLNLDINLRIMIPHLTQNYQIIKVNNEIINKNNVSPHNNYQIKALLIEFNRNFNKEIKLYKFNLDQKVLRAHKCNYSNQQMKFKMKLENYILIKINIFEVYEVSFIL